MGHALSLHELHTISAGDIEALPHAVAIKSGDRTVGVLLPVQHPSPDYVRVILAEIDRAVARHTPEEEAAIDRLLAEREAD